MKSYIEIHDVGFGECIVLGSGYNEILMVDCGSMNIKVHGYTFSEYVSKYIVPRYYDVKKRSFLLTHFHKDHLCGFKYILRKHRKYFDKIFIPFTPIDANGRALLIELAIYAFTFLRRQKNCSLVSTSAIFIFDFLVHNCGAEFIFTIKKGDVLNILNQKYSVLNPNSYDFNFSTNFAGTVEKLDDFIRLENGNKAAGDFLRLKHDFCKEYIRCCNLCHVNGNRNCAKIYESCKIQKELILKISKLIPDLRRLKYLGEIECILNSKELYFEYSYMQNSSSVVFQNAFKTDKENILMTGDITAEYLGMLKKELFGSYNVVKAPHHGTKSYYSDVLNVINVNNFLISNGVYHAGGPISEEYIYNRSIKHCTENKICKYFLSNNFCCNRLSYCNNLVYNGDMAIHCKNRLNIIGASGCNIYVVSGNLDKGCFCD